MSLYDYCNGDPINFFDPDGFEPIGYNPPQARTPSLFQLFFPAHAALMGAPPMTGSTMGDIQMVHGTVYPALTPVLLPGAAYFNPRVQGG